MTGPGLRQGRIYLGGVQLSSRSACERWFQEKICCDCGDCLSWGAWTRGGRWVGLSDPPCPRCGEDVLHPVYGACGNGAHNVARSQQTTVRRSPRAEGCWY